MSLYLPTNPSLENLKNQAKTLLKSYQAGNSEVLSKIKKLHPSFSSLSKFGLRNAQLVIAREYGFDNWSDLKKHVQLREKTNIETFIELIRDQRNQEALDTLNASPALATAHSAREGQLHGASPLHWAAHRNATDLCERLIALVADVNDSASDWWLTPLAWGADAGSAEAVELLLKRGADVDQDAVVGTTALNAVAMGGSSQGSRDPEAYKRTAEILIAHGANVNGRPDREQTPLDDAIEYKNDHVAAVLRKHGAAVSNPSD